MAVEEGAVWSAVVLAGGTAARLDGVDKAGVEIGGRTLLEHVLAALAGAAEVVVVGESVPTSVPVTFTRESPEHGGPVAGLVAGVAALARRPDLLAVVAVDMPRVTTDTLTRLRTAAGGARHGAFLTDGGDRIQLAGVLTHEALAGLPDAEAAHGCAVRTLLEGLDLARVPARAQEATDVDTWSDLYTLAGGEVDRRR